MEFNNIQITHLVNPQKFWFKISAYDKKFIEFDLSLQNHLKLCDVFGGNCSADQIDLDALEIDQVVAYFEQKWQRWFRGRVQTKSVTHEICLFLLDFGFPIVTHLNLIQKIPIEFQLWNNENLKFGAINQILPATAELDVTVFDVQMTITDQWSSNSVNIVQKLIAESSSICFISEFELNGQLFGKLFAVLAKANVKQEISSILIKLQQAVFVDNISDKFGRPLSSMSNLSNSFQRCETPMSGLNEIRSDIERNINREPKTPSSEISLPRCNLQPSEVSVSLNMEAKPSKSGSAIENKIKEPIDQTVGLFTQISNNNIDSPELSDQSSLNNEYNRKMSTKSENSNTSGSNNILDYSESDINLTSSPHLAKILNKMRTIKRREQAKLKSQSDVSMKEEFSPKTKDMRYQSISSSENDEKINRIKPYDNLTIENEIKHNNNIERASESKTVVSINETSEANSKTKITKPNPQASNCSSRNIELNSEIKNKNSAKDSQHNGSTFYNSELRHEVESLEKFNIKDSVKLTQQLSNKSNNIESLVDNKQQDSKIEFEVKKQPTKVVKRSSNLKIDSSGNHVSTCGSELSQNKASEAGTKPTTATPSASKSFEVLETCGKREVNKKMSSDSSSNETSPFKSTYSAGDSNSADNELWSSNLRSNSSHSKEIESPKTVKIEDFAEAKQQPNSNMSNKIDSLHDDKNQDSTIYKIFELNKQPTDGMKNTTDLKSDMLETSGKRESNTKRLSDSSSIETSTTKSTCSARHSNSADNELSTSNRGSKSIITPIKPPYKLTKKIGDPRAKYEKLTDATNSDSSTNLVTLYDPLKQHQSRKCTFFEKEQKQIVLVHGHTKINPVEALDQVNFSRKVHHALDKLALNRLFRIDSYTWPNCLNGTSFVVIGAEKTGKTISYLPPLINLILMEEEDGGIIDEYGPIALIVAPTNEKVSSIFHMCKEINRYSDNKLTICKGHGIPNDKLTTSLIRGVHILISTPGCLNRLLNLSVPLIHPERVKFFVIDDYHLMTNQINLIKKIIRSSCIINPETELYEQQIIVTSLYWDNTFMAMLNKTNNSFICIGSYMESAYYGKQDIKLLFMRKEDKLIKIHELLSNKEYRLKHTLIVCRDSTEVESIVKHLSDWSLDVIGCNRYHSSEMIIRLINEWNDRNDCNLKIVVCTDDILPELHLSRVKVLIHFSLSMSWSKFQYRYSTFFDIMPNLLKKENVETKSIVLIDETNNSELPRFIDFLKIHGIKQIHPDIEQISNEIRIQKEADKKHQLDFCKYILKTGVCKQQNICQYRHTFVDEDKSKFHLDIKNYITFKVAHVCSPTHFMVNILGTRDSLNDHWIKFNKENYKIFNIKFKLHYSVKENHIHHPTCNKGDLCTINIVEKFYRCKILNVGEKKGVLSDRRVLVQAIDVGENYKTTESRLLFLPDQFKEIPSKLVDMRVGGIIPIDKETKWDSESTAFVQKYFDKNEKKSELFLEATSSFIIADTLYVESVVFKRDLGKFGGGELEVLNYKTDAIKNNIGVLDEESFNCAKELLRAADFKVFKTETVQTKLSLPPTPQTSPEGNSVVIPIAAPQTPPNGNSAIIPITTPQIPPTEDSVIIPTIAEKPLLTENINSDSLHSTSETTNINHKINSNQELLPKLKMSSKKLGVTLPSTIECINLSSFVSPSNFCVQKISSLSVINARLYEIQEYVTDLNHKKLENVAVGDICLVFYDGYYDRAEIISVSDDEVFVIICDLGFGMTFNKTDLYEIDDAIKNQPFEAIKCQLFGLKPNGDETMRWTENCIDEIYNHINDNYKDHYVKKVMEITTEECPKYNVMLCGVNDETGMEIINKVLVEKGWAQYNDEVRAVFNQASEALVAEFDENIKSVVVQSNVFSSEDFDEELFFNSLSYEECFELFNFPPEMLPASITEITDDVTSGTTSKNIVHRNGKLPTARITEIIEDVASDTKNITQNPINETISYGDRPPPLVSWCYHLLPLETLWHQDASTITLKINVTDHVDYSIELHKRLLKVCVQFENQTYREITINLFGVVSAQNFESTIVGNYLKVVLMKSIQMNLLWPRLLLDDKKLSWLRYNYDTFKDFEAKGNIRRGDDYIQYKIKRMESSSDTESDEELDEDDECDPLSTQYNFVENKYFDENTVKMITN